MRILTILTMAAMILTSFAALAAADHPPAMRMEPVGWSTGDGTSAPLVGAEGGTVHVIDHEERSSVGGVDAGVWSKGSSAIVGGGDAGFEDPLLGIWGNGNIGYEGAGVHAWGTGETRVHSGDADVGFQDLLLGHANASVRGAGVSSGKGTLGVGSAGGAVRFEDPLLGIWGNGNIGLEAAGFRFIWGNGNIGLETDGASAWAPLLV